MRWVGHVEGMGRGEVHTGFWWGQLRGKRSLGRPRHRWEDNFKMDLQEVGWWDMNWIVLAKDWDRWPELCKCGNET